MTEAAYNKIKEGLDEALSIARGEAVPHRIRRPRITVADLPRFHANDFLHTDEDRAAYEAEAKREV